LGYYPTKIIKKRKRGYLFQIAMRMIARRKKRTPMPTEIHRGAKTQTHAQLMTPVSLRTMKTIVKTVPTPMPPEVVTVFEVSLTCLSPFSLMP